MGGYFEQIVILIGINLMLALSLHVVLGETGLFSVGSSAFMAIGAYVATVFFLKFNIPFYVCILFAGVFSGVTALIVGIPTLSLKGDYLLMGTFGFAEVTRVVLLNMEVTNGALGIAGIPILSHIYNIYAIFLILFFVTLLLINSKVGRAWRAIREDEIAARALGINTAFYKNVAFVTSAVFAGVAGALYAFNIGFISPGDFSMVMAFTVYLFIVLGGLGDVYGAMIATALLTALPELLRSAAEYRMMAYGLALVVLVIYFPKGIFDKIGSLKLKLRKMRGTEGDV